ncbi:MAG: NAD(P)H-hydrate dehydratase [Proteobacteria bacterium]|jgi:ADP-dependent NAD(P)H-hydrate dehydratase / NAD(P)H-hydrate epimerase|nr:NAD(P)H-hydrate dehydratase [Pseudomonadota bacterium]
MINKHKHCILSTAQMAMADQIAITELKKHGRSGLDLMEQAGLAVVRHLSGMIGPGKVLIMCGPGNNGGDGFVIARHLKALSWAVDVALFGPKARLKGDARHMAERWDGDILSLKSVKVNAPYDVVVDAVFGTGLAKDIVGDLKKTIDIINSIDAYKVAVDIPSGVQGDTGKILASAFKADCTITFFREKPAHSLYPGKDYCGKVIVAEIGITDRVFSSVKPTIHKNHPDLWKNSLPKSHPSSHKYDKGHAVVVSGGVAHTGAARLAAKASLRIGAGLVSVSSPKDAISIHAAHLTAIMIRNRDDLKADLCDRRLNAWCIGPAAGVTIETKLNVMDILSSGKKTVLDADALSVFENQPVQLFESLHSDCVLTPHGGEFIRLFPKLKTEDKLSASLTAAKISGAVIVYKGADTVIASPNGHAAISTNAPATLATAGTGDVLAGLITGFLAQGMSAYEAACAAVWIHGECANRFGQGLISEDLESLIPSVLTSLTS